MRTLKNQIIGRLDQLIYEATRERDDAWLMVDRMRGQIDEAKVDRDRSHAFRAESEKRFDDLMYALGCVPSEGVEAGIEMAHRLRRDNIPNVAACMCPVCVEVRAGSQP